MKRVLLIAALAGLGLAPASGSANVSCPALLPEAQLRELDIDDELLQYATLRWLLCGPESALPVLPVLRDAYRALAIEEAQDDPDEHAPLPPADLDEAFTEIVLAGISMNPQALVDGMIEARDEADDETDELQPALAAYWRLRVDRAQMLRNYEAGLRPAITFLRRGPLSPATDQLLELALIGQEIRQGRIEDARAHLDRVNAALSTPSDDEPAQARREIDGMLRERLKTLVEALAPVQSISPAPPDRRWLMDKSTGRFQRAGCGFGAMAEAMFGAHELRAEVFRQADTDAVIAELLHQEWSSLVEGRSVSARLLEYLRKRYAAAELQTALGDALASVRSENGAAGLVLFGQSLPLPVAVIEGNATVPDGTRERPLGVAELVVLVQATHLYRELVGGQPTAMNSAGG